MPLGTATNAGTTAGLEASPETLGEPGGGVARTALQTVTALGVVIGLVLLARWGYRKLGGRMVTRSSPVVEVLSRTMVAPRSHVLLLRVGPRVLVVSDSSAGARTLAEVTDPEEVADLLGTLQSEKSDSPSGNFGRLLGRMNASLEEDASEEGSDHREHGIDRLRDTLASVKGRLQFATTRREEAL